MTEPSGTPSGDELNFDRAIPAVDSEKSAADGQVWCANCRRPLVSEYHTANGAPLCGECRTLFEQAAQPVKEPALLGKAALFGLGATLVGAVIYWAVMKFLNLEIGLVAILTGWMVGRAVRTGAGGRGGRLLQIGAALLVYLSVAMAYFPFAVESMMDGAPAAASTEVAPIETGTADSPSLLAFVLVAGFALALPVMAILGAMPSGLISAAIIGFGMHQAWQLTAAPQFTFEGPFKIGDGASETS